MNVTPERTAKLLKLLRDKHDIDWCSHYGEKGYTDPATGIILGNWNNIKNITQDYLKEAGFEMEWSDEWTIDCNSSKTYRTSPDSYSWVCAVSYDKHCELLTPDSDVQDWIDARQVTLENIGELLGALPDWITAEQLEELGYTKMEGAFESGHHAGQADDPRNIARKALEEGAESVVFRLKESSQFYVVFEGFSKAKEDEDENAH